MEIEQEAETSSDEFARESRIGTRTEVVNCGLFLRCESPALCEGTKLRFRIMFAVRLMIFTAYQCRGSRVYRSSQLELVVEFEVWT